MTLRIRYLALVVLALVVGSCSDRPTGPGAGPDPTQPVTPAAFGLMEITLQGIGTAQMSASAQPYRGGVPSGISSGEGPGASYSLSGLGGADERSTIQLEPLSSGGFTDGTRGGGGMRYLWATFRVRNARLDGTAYDTPRENLTFLAVDTDGTIGQTAFSALNRFDGSTADDALATEIVPTGAVYQESGALRSAEPDVLQLLTESEVDAIASAATGVSSVFPYGFVVRDADLSGSRTLPASPAADEYDGVVTFAVKIPLQASEPQDPYTVRMVVLPVDDSEVRITQSAEEQTPTALAAFEARAQKLGATQVTLLPGSSYSGSIPARTLCGVRIAGTRGAASATLGDCAPPVASFTTGGSTQAGAPTTFNAYASASGGAGELIYSWDFGDGVRGGTEAIAHLYTAAGSYTATLIVTNPAGLADTVTQTLSITAPPAPTGTGTLSGAVTDAAGSPLEGVTATLVGGSPSGTTDSKGEVEITGFPAGTPVTVELTKSGYADRFVRVEIPEGSSEGTFMAALQTRNAPKTLYDAEDGGAVSDEDGVKITLPAGALVDGSGNPVTGAVEVALTPVDVSDTTEIEAFPGSFTALDPTGDEGILLSLGVAEYELTQGGDELQIAAGKTATIEIPIYTSGSSVGDSVALWSLDEKTGVWSQEGMGVVVASGASPTGLALRATITHLSWWNADHWNSPYRPIPECKIRDKNGLPTIDLSETCYIEGRMVGPNGPQTRATGNAPPGGGLPFPVPSGMEVRLEAYAQNGMLYGEAIVSGGPGESSNVVIGLSPVGTGGGVEGDSIAADTTFLATTDSVGAVDRYTFHGTKGQWVQISASQPTSSSLTGTISLALAGGDSLAEASFPWGEGKIVQELPETGTYLIEVVGTANAPGAYQLTLEEIPVVALNSNTSGTIGGGDGHQVYAFYAEAGTYLATDVLGPGGPYSGSSSSVISELNGQTYFVKEGDHYAIPKDGYYLLHVNSRVAGDFTVGLAVLEEPTPLTFDAKGRAVLEDRSLEIVGDRHYYSFTAAEGDGLFAEVEATGGDATPTDNSFRVSWVGNWTYVSPREDVPSPAAEDTIRSVVHTGARFESKSTGNYVIAVWDYRIEPATSTYALRVHQVAHSTAITVDDDLQQCPGADTRSLRAALYAIGDGGTVTTCAGRYEAAIPLQLQGSDVTLTGTSEDAVVLGRLGQEESSYDGSNVLEFGRETTNPVMENLTVEVRDVTDRSRGINLDETSRPTVRNVTIRPTEGMSEYGYGLAAVPDSTLLENLTIEDARYGIWLGHGGGVTITGSTLTGITDEAIGGGEGGQIITDNSIELESAESYIVALNLDGGGHRIENNTITVSHVYNNRHDYTIRLEGGRGSFSNTPTIIRGNTINTNTFGIFATFAEEQQGILIEQNRITCSGENGCTAVRLYGQGSADAALVIRNNLLDGVGGSNVLQIGDAELYDKVAIVNNTVRHGAAADYGGAQPTVRIDRKDYNFTGALPVVLVNNIFSGGGDQVIRTPEGTTIDSDYNLFYNFDVLYDGGSTSTGTHRLTADPLRPGYPDPLFANALLELQPGSPAIDAGASKAQYPDVPEVDYDGTPRPQGGGVDIGAHDQ